MRSLGDALSGHDNALNLLRLLLATAVIIWHTYPVLGMEPGWGAADVGAGAVNGFFAISGYLIAGSRMRLSLGAYMWRRALRIYPGFWVALAVTGFVFAPVASALGGGGYSLSDGFNYVVQNITLWIGEQRIGETLAGVPKPDVWNASLWTLFYEFAAYVLIGIALSMRPVRRWLAPIALVVTLGLSIAHGLGLGFDLPGPLSYIAQAFRLWSFFAAGVLVYALRDRIPAHWGIGIVALAALMASLMLGVGAWASQLPLTLVLIWLGGLIPLRIGARNDISYGMYVYAFPIQQLLFLAVGGNVSPWVFMLLSALVTLPVACASWWLVEKPVMRYKTPIRHTSPRAQRQRSAT